MPDPTEKPVVVSFLINLLIRETPAGWAFVVSSGDGEVVLRDGYKHPQQALAAFIEALTYAPPDLAVYDDALSKVSELIDSVGNLNDAMSQVGTRLADVEDAITQLGGRRERVNPLLAPRQPQQAPPQAPAGPAPLRTPRISIGMQSHMGAGIVGGVSRRGARTWEDEGES